MTIKDSHDALLGLLKETQTNRVIALSGKWGTGKTHLWNQIQNDEEFKNGEVGRALYVSLFGVADLNTLKLKILQSDLPAADENGTLTELAKKSWPIVTKAMANLHPALGGVELLPLLAVPVVLHMRFIVLDDIERKHEKLGVDELLGFVDECTQKFKARVLLILNTGELGDASSKLWERFREKVIDAEVVLNTTPEEAFDIAVQKSPTAYADLIREAVAACGLTNIRVIGKVIRTVNKLLTPHPTLSAASLQRAVPSTVLLTAIHFRGLDDGPTTEYVVEFQKPIEPGILEALETKPPSPPAPTPLPRWKLMMSALGIKQSGAYETIAAEYLKSGSIDSQALNSVLRRYEDEATLAETEALDASFVEAMQWHWYLSDAQRLDQAKELVGRARWLEPWRASDLHRIICKIAGGEEVADQLITAWIETAPERDKKRLGEWATSPLLHPTIQEYLRPQLEVQEAETTLPAVMEKVVVGMAWGYKEKAVMNCASIADYDLLLRDLRGEALKKFLLWGVDLLARPKDDAASFKNSMQRFRNACRHIVEDPAVPRLGTLIRAVFEDAGLDSRLQSPGPEPLSEYDALEQALTPRD